MYSRKYEIWTLEFSLWMLIKLIIRLMNLIPSGMASSMSQAIDDIHDTLSRDIIIINEKANAVVSDFDDNYNAFSDKKDPDITYTAETNTIKARIKWFDKAELDTQLVFPGGQGSNNGTSIPLIQNYGIVRIKIKNQYKDLIKQSTKIIVDGSDCQLYFSATDQSIINLNYTIFYLIHHE